jgi:hypothetical protein
MSWHDALTRAGGFLLRREEIKSLHCGLTCRALPAPRATPDVPLQRTGGPGRDRAAPISWTGSSVHSPPTSQTHSLSKVSRTHLHRAYGGRTTRSQTGPRASCHRRGRRLSTGRTWHLASATAPLPRGAQPPPPSTLSAHKKNITFSKKKKKKDDEGRSSSSRNCLASNDPFRAGASSLTLRLPPPPRRSPDQQKPIPPPPTRARLPLPWRGGAAADASRRRIGRGSHEP